jgi:hypothetical protein
LRKGLRWAVLLGVSIGTVAPLLIAVWLFLGVAAGDGSRSGNILRAGGGGLMVLVAVLVLGTWAGSSRASDRRGNSFRDIET